MVCAHPPPTAPPTLTQRPHILMADRGEVFRSVAPLRGGGNGGGGGLSLEYELFQIKVFSSTRSRSGRLLSHRGQKSGAPAFFILG